MRRRTGAGRWAARLAPAALAVLLLEGGLRLFGYTDGPSFLLPDASLRWVPRPGFEDGGIRINALGLRGKEAAPRPVPGRLRVACLGDSCVFGPAGGAGYPELLEGLLDAQGCPAEVLNAGVPGYSVLQGLGWFRARVAALRPAVVAVAFGWNDHWENGDGRPDAEQAGTLRSRLLALRLVQLARAARRRLPGGGGSAPGGAEGDARSGGSLPRVPPEDFRRLLAALAREARAGGARVLILTPPAGVDGGWTGGGVPFPAGSGPPRRIPGAALAALHGRYLAIAREVAQAEGCTLVDLEAAFAAAGRARLFDDPSADPVHPNAAGMRLIAERLAEAVLGASAP